MTAAFELNVLTVLDRELGGDADRTRSPTGRAGTPSASASTCSCLDRRPGGALRGPRPRGALRRGRGAAGGVVGQVPPARPRGGAGRRGLVVQRWWTDGDYALALAGPPDQVATTPATQAPAARRQASSSMRMLRPTARRAWVVDPPRALTAQAADLRAVHPGHEAEEQPDHRDHEEPDDRDRRTDPQGGVRHPRGLQPSAGSRYCRTVPRPRIASTATSTAHPTGSATATAHTTTAPATSRDPGRRARPCPRCRPGSPPRPGPPPTSWPQPGRPGDVGRAPAQVRGRRRPRTVGSGAVVESGSSLSRSRSPAGEGSSLWVSSVTEAATSLSFSPCSRAWWAQNSTHHR